MRRKFFKIIIAVILMVSVFLCNSLVVMAADGDDEWPEVPGHFDGSYVFRGYNSYVVIGGSAFSFDGQYVWRFFSDDFVIGYFAIEFQPGYSYDGHINFDLSASFAFYDGNPAEYVSLNIVSSSGTNWSVYGGSAYGHSSATSIPVTVTFNNYSVSTGTTVLIPIMASFNGMTRDVTASSIVAYVSSVSVSGFSNDLWEAAQVYDGSTVQYYIYEQTKIIEANNKAEMEQQQQIANQQAEQSRQQHEDLKTGYDTSGINSIQQNQQAQLDAYQDQQDQVINNAYDQIGAFTDEAFSTSSISAYATSFAFVGLLFNKLWSSFGNFTTVLVLMLSLGVAGFILQIRKGG